MPGTTNIIHDILQDYEHYLLQTSNGYAVASNQFEDTFWIIGMIIYQVNIKIIMK